MGTIIRIGKLCNDCVADLREELSKFQRRTAKTGIKRERKTWHLFSEWEERQKLNIDERDILRDILFLMGHKVY